jgi:hypothetical protein
LRNGAHEKLKIASIHYYIMIIGGRPFWFLEAGIATTSNQSNTKNKKKENPMASPPSPCTGPPSPSTGRRRRHCSHSSPVPSESSMFGVGN